MGDKAVFCARNTPLDLEDDFIQRWLSSLYPACFPQGNDSIYAAMHFIDSWFPLKSCHNMSHKPISPMIPGQYFFVGNIYMAKHFIEWNLPFKEGICAAARALYRKNIAAEHFIESWNASSKSLYRAELSSKPFIEDGHGPVQFIQRVGLPEMT